MKIIQMHNSCKVCTFLWYRRLCWSKKLLLISEMKALPTEHNTVSLGQPPGPLLPTPHTSSVPSTPSALPCLCLGLSHNAVQPWTSLFAFWDNWLTNSYPYFKAQLSGSLSFMPPSLSCHNISHFVLYYLSSWLLDQDHELLETSDNCWISYFPIAFILFEHPFCPRQVLPNCLVEEIKSQMNKWYTPHYSMSSAI